MTHRQSWDEYFMDMAKAAATRATCPRLQVGCVIIIDQNPVCTGYNGSVRGAPHCIDVGCNVNDKNHCVSTVHAEANAIFAAARSGRSISYATAYVTYNPCINCFMALYQAGIKRIVYNEIYKEVDYGILGINGNQMPSIVKLSKNDLVTIIK